MTTNTLSRLFLNVLLENVYTAPARGYLASLRAIETLRKVWLHHFWFDKGEPRYRDAKDLAPANVRLNSPYDPEAAFGKKGTFTWTGYKVFVTKTCDAAAPRIITHVVTTGAGASDVDQTAKVHEALRDKHLLPKMHLADGGFVDADLLLEPLPQASRKDRHLMSVARIGVSRVPQPVTDEVKREHGNDDKDHGHEQPGCLRDGVNVPGFVKERAPTHDGRTQP